MLLVALASAAAPPPLVHAEPTDGFAQVVLLRHTTADGSVAFICTGTLVAPDVVLTAAHCLTDVEGYTLTDIRVSSGSVWNDTVPERFAASWETHPDYAVSDDGLDITADLGLVYLDEPYDLVPATLGSKAIADAAIGTPFRHVGWGASSDTAHDQGYAKRVGDIPLVGLDGDFLLSEDGEDGVATCGGDSGGPVFRITGEGVGSLIGVHSFGRDDDGTICAGSTSGDTRVDLYLDWIVGAVPDALTDAPAPADEGGGDDDTAGEAPDAAGCSTPGSAPAVALPAAIAALAALGRRRAVA